LQADLWDDERYARWTASVGASEAVVAVRMDQRSRSFGPDEVEARAAELGFPSAGASGNDVGDEGYRTAIFDAVAGEYELSALLELLEREREECRFEYDEDDYEADPRELDAAETELKWANVVDSCLHHARSSRTFDVTNFRLHCTIGTDETPFSSGTSFRQLKAFTIGKVVLDRAASAKITVDGRISSARLRSITLWQFLRLFSDTSQECPSTGEPKPMAVS
jgi:hypothetical protein